MPYKYFLILPLLVLFSCSDDSACIEDRIQEFSSQNEGINFTGIYQFIQDGETFYIFDDGVAFDAVAEVVDADCNLVCAFGGFRTQNDTPCEEYQEAINNAEQIWP